MIVSYLDINMRGNTADLDKSLDKSKDKMADWKKQNESKLFDLSKAFNTFGGAAAQAAGQGFLGNLSNMGLAIGEMSAASVLAIGAIVGSLIYLYSWAKDSFAGINQLAKTARLFQTTNAEIAGLQHAAVVLGMSVEDLDTRLMHMQKGIAEAAHGGGDLAATFAFMGLQAQNLIDLPVERQLAAIAEGINKTGTQADKVRMAMQIFGKGGADILPMLRQGESGLKGFKKEAEELGLAVSGPQAEAVRSVSRSWRMYGEALVGVGRSLAVIVAPILSVIVSWIQRLADWLARTVVEAMPYWEAFWAMVHAGWTMFGEMGTEVLNAIGSLFPSLGNLMADLGITWENVGILFIKVLAHMEFAFKKWRDMWQVSVDTVRLTFIGLANDAEYYFMKKIPNALKFMPTPEREFTALELRLATRINEMWPKLSKEWTEFVARKQFEYIFKTPRTPEPTPPQGSQIVTEAQKPKVAYAESAEAFSILNNTLKDKMLNAANKQLGEQARIRKAVEKLGEMFLLFPILGKARL